MNSSCTPLVSQCMNSSCTPVVSQCMNSLYSDCAITIWSPPTPSALLYLEHLVKPKPHYCHCPSRPNYIITSLVLHQLLHWHCPLPIAIAIAQVVPITSLRLLHCANYLLLATTWHLDHLSDKGFGLVPIAAFKHQHCWGSPYIQL